MSHRDVAGTRHDVDEVLSGFVHAVRAAGIQVPVDGTHQFFVAIATLGLTHDGVRCAASATLCRSPRDVETMEAVFSLYFRADLTLIPQDRAAETASAEVGMARFDDESSFGGEGEEDVATAATKAEVLRQRDVSQLTDAERAWVERQLNSLVPAAARRRRSRKRPHRRGDVDAGRTARATLRLMGEQAPLRRRERMAKPRPTVLLIDVSGSMTAYADMLLRLAHVLTTRMSGPVETFTFGTRVTRVTRELAAPNSNHAMAAVARAVPDWSGGTRLGENMHAFLARWGKLGRTRGAVVVVFSDGWESGDAHQLAAEAARLQRLSHKVLWVNPHRGKPGYRAVQQGILAVLPHVDALLAGHSLATFQAVLDEITQA